MYQATTRVNVLSPEITSIVEAEALHDDRKLYCCNDVGQEAAALPGSEAVA